MTLSSHLLTDIVGSPTDVDSTITFRAAFFGFSISAILFGITLRQGYQYFAYTMMQDAFVQISVAGAACILDASNLVFGMNLLYCYTLHMLGSAGTGCHIVWNLKALAITHVLLILLVQGHYLTQIWLFACREIPHLDKLYVWSAKIYVIIVVVLGTVITTFFLAQIPSIDSAFSFSLRLECIMYLGLGTTAVVDCTTAAAMCLMLNRCSSGIDTTGSRRLQRVLHGLVKYFIGTGLITSFAAIMAIVMYVVRPHTMLYLAMEFSVTRLYANAILANYNTRPLRRQLMDATTEIDLEVIGMSGHENRTDGEVEFARQPGS